MKSISVAHRASDRDFAYTYRIERTELHTRIWEIEADSEEDALDRYMDEEDDENQSYHAGHPDVRIGIRIGGVLQDDDITARTKQAQQSEGKAK